MKSQGELRTRNPKGLRRIFPSVPAPSLYHFVTVSLVTLFLAACSATRMPEGSRPAGLATTTPGLPQRVAILPLVNGTDRKEASDVVRAALHQQLNATTYTVQKLFVTDELLARGGLQDAEAVAKATPAELGRLLNVDAVVVGRVTDYSSIYAVVYAQVAVGASVQLIEVSSGKVLWEKSHVQRSHGGSAAMSPWGLIAAAGMTALHLRDAEFLHVADDLARELIATLPVPTAPRALRPPSVAAVASDATGETRRAGQRIQVAVVGPPGLRGSFDLVGLKVGLPLEEGPDGVYRGEYTVVAGDKVPHVVVVGALVDAQGLRGERQDGRGAIRVDTAPPASPQQVKAIPGDGMIQLSWPGVADSDLAGYRVYRSDRPLSGFGLVSTTEHPNFRDTGVPNLTPVYYRVASLDTADNESSPSDTVAAMPIPPGPTLVKGEVIGEVRWYQAATPYILADEVIVATGATLTIEAGVRVLSRGRSLHVRGRLVALGTAGAPLEFARDPETAEGMWDGVWFEGLGGEKNALTYCRITGAGTGIRVANARVEIRECTVSGNKVGIEVAGETASLSWLGGRLETNRERGMLVQGGTVRLEGLEVLANAGDGIRVAGGTAEIVSSFFARDGGAGILREGGTVVLRRNRFEARGGPQVVNLLPGQLLDARENYWGTTDPETILGSVSAWVDASQALEGLSPEAKIFALPILRPPLKDGLRGLGILVPWFGAYTIPDRFEIGDGGILRITPGVALSFGPKATGILVRGGTIIAEGTWEFPVTFTSGSTVPAPGDYGSAIRIERAGPVPNRLIWAQIRHATTGLRLEAGRTEISYGEVADNRLNGIEVSGTASVTITGARIVRNPNGAALVVTGDAKPTLRRNTIADNGWAILNQTPYPLDARENWWGTSTPSDDLIVGAVDWSQPLQAEPVETGGR